MKAIMAAKKAASKAKDAKARAAATMAKGQALAEKAQAKGQALAEQSQSIVDQVAPKINSEPYVNMSEPIGYINEPTQPTVPISEKFNKFKDAKIETQIGYPQIALTIILGIFYVAVTALGIKVYNGCTGIQGSKKYQNLKGFLSHTMAIALTIPCVLLLQKLVTNQGGIFTVVYACMGLTGAAIAMDIMRQPDCDVKSSEKNFVIASLVGWILTLLIGGYFTVKKYPKIGEAARAAGQKAAAGAKIAGQRAASGARSAAGAVRQKMA
tara:strand:+ start:119 stop:922 length:804 start_codon:yes stop_codon:yes gene_type:complete